MDTSHFDSHLLLKNSARNEGKNNKPNTCNPLRQRDEKRFKIVIIFLLLILLIIF
jgi:hypothetical protein